MSDLVSRQAVLSLPIYNEKNLYGNIIREYVDIEDVKQLPSAELGTNLAELGTDCISRQQAVDALRKMQTYKLFSGDDMLLIDQAGAQTELMLLPPAQPKIIRCKNCKHWIPYDWMFSEVWQSRNIADYPEDEMGCKWCDMSMKANDFCSRADRREVTT